MRQREKQAKREGEEIHSKSTCFTYSSDTVPDTFERDTNREWESKREGERDSANYLWCYQHLLLAFCLGKFISRHIAHQIVLRFFCGCKYPGVPQTAGVFH